ncbi:MAG: 50S ribosomal protein L25 [Opitutales bacterium]
MNQIKLPVKERQEIGNNTAKRCRKSGGIPAVIYGESGTKALVVDKIEYSKIEKFVTGKAALLDLDYANGTQDNYAVIKKVERDSVTCEIMHIDFLEVVRGKPMTVVLPLRAFGESIGVKNGGGVIEMYHHEVKAVCRPRDLPEEVVIDISSLEAGKSLSVADLPKMEGIEFVDNAERVLIACTVSAKAAAELAAEANK